MPVTFFSSHVVHVFFHGALHVIRQCIRDRTHFVSAIACATDSCRRVVLVSSEGDICHLTVNDHLTDLPDNFFAASKSQINNYAIDKKIPFGHAISAASIPPSSLHGECDCQLVVCASLAFFQISFHSLKVTHSHFWKNATSPLAFVLPLSKGPLRNVLVPPACIGPACITITVTGCIRVNSGGNVYTAFSRKDWVDGSSDLVNMHQTPIFCNTDSDFNFAIIIGCFSAVIILHRGKNSQLKYRRFLLHDSSNRLQPSSFVVRKRGVCFLELEDMATSRRISITYDLPNCEICFTHDEANSMKLVETRDEAHDTVFRRLIRGIEEMGERQHAADVENASIQRLISSYNAALLFVMQWKRRSDTEKTINDFIGHCRLSIDSTAAPDSPLFNLPPPVTGKRCFLTVSLRNATTVALSEGWKLHMRISKMPFSRNHAINTQGEPPRKSGIPTTGIEKSVLRELHASVKHIAPGAEAVFSFPIVLDSHVPIFVTALLCFQHPAAVRMMQRDGINVEVVLRDSVPIDVFDFSSVKESPMAHDLSHEWLAHAQVTRLFDSKSVQKRRVHPLMRRFEVPLTKDKVMHVLSLKVLQTHFESVLDAQFMIAISDVSPVADGGVTTITLQGVPHVFYFVRSAIFQRLVRYFSMSNGKIHSFPNVQVHGSGNIERWKRGMIDVTDKCMRSFRDAESEMVGTLRVFGEIEQGENIHLCQDGKERDLLVKAITKARTSHDEWRRKTEQVWSPQGVTYSEAEET